MIDSAIAALKAGDPGAALTVLIDLWRETRSSALADAIDQLWARAPRGALESKLRTTFKRSVADDQEWLRRLEPFGVDPRIATAMIRWLNDPPVALKRPRSMAFWSGVVDALMRIKDPRSTAVTATWVLPGSRLREQLQVLQSHAATWSETPVNLDALAPFLKVTASPVEEALQAVYRAPHDLTLRRVCADVLSEAGDPRGEFISLQLTESRTDAQRARQRQLLKKHGRAWLGALASIERKGSARFENGFLVDIDLFLRAEDPAAFEKFVGLDVLSTVEVLHLDHWWGDHLAMLEHPVMRSLRSVSGASSDLLEGTQVLQLEKLQIWNADDANALLHFFQGLTMPRLRSIWLADFTSPPSVLRLWNTPLMRQLDTFLLAWVPHGSLPAWLEQLPLVPTNIRELRIGNPLGRSSARLVRSEGNGWRCKIFESREYRAGEFVETRERLVRSFKNVSFE